MLHLTRITRPGHPLAKTFSLLPDGMLHKTHAAAAIDAVAERIEVPHMADFVALLGSLRTDQALLYGVPVSGAPSLAVTTARDLEDNPRPGVIARTREHFAFAQAPGVWMLDYDPPPGAAPLAPDALRRKLLDVVPELAGADMVMSHSASSFIVRSGEVLRGLAGQRIYIAVADTSRIPEAGKRLVRRLWAAGHGYFAVSRAGTLLPRTLLDAGVWQPERLDFAAGAACVPPLIQRRPPPQHFPGHLLDLGMLRDVTPAEQVQAKQMRQMWQEIVEPERVRLRREYIESRAAEWAGRPDATPERVTEVIAAACDDGLLYADFVLHPHRGEPVTVGEVLDDPATWHGRRFADPIEPGYGNDPRIARANLHTGAAPTLYSHAHGGRRYELVRQRRSFDAGGDSQTLLAPLLELLKIEGRLFSVGDALGFETGGRLMTASESYLHLHIATVARFSKEVRGRTVPCDPPPRLIAHLMACPPERRRLPRLRAVVDQPTLRADGTLLDVPGFDRASGVLLVSYDSPAAFAPIPHAPTLAQAVDALRKLMEPFAGFPFASPEARGVALAALLTACVRGSLPTAPAFAFDAPAAGSGKTLLARCISAMAGDDGSTLAPPGDDEEMRKVLLARVREGARVVIIDNVTRAIEGDAVCQFVTAPMLNGRLLGTNTTVTLPIAAMLVFTGNNIAVQADAARRVLVCRLDPQVERPFERRFGFDPFARVEAERSALVRAALTVMRGWQVARSHHGHMPPPLGSFEAWDGLVRQTVAWLAGVQTNTPLADPVATINESLAGDDTLTALAAMLRAWAKHFPQGARAGDALTTSAFNAHDLREALDGAFDGRPMTSRGLGRWLAKRRGQIVEGLRFASYKAENGEVWRAVSAQ